MTLLFKEKTKHEKFISFFTVKIPYKIECFYYALKSIPRKLNRIYRWFPAVYRWEWWDYSYTYELMILQFEEQLKHFKNRKKVMMMDKQRKEIVSQISLCINVLKNMVDDKHSTDLYNKLNKKYPCKYVFEPVYSSESNEDRVCSRLVSLYENPKHEKLHSKALIKGYDKIRKLKKADWDVFCKSFRESEGWWD